MRTAKEALHHIQEEFDGVLAKMTTEKNFMGFSSEFVHEGQVYGLKLYRSNDEKP